MPKARKQLVVNDDTLWYLVGLIVTDGCLSSDGRHVDITAKDALFLETIREKAGLVCKVGIKNYKRKNQGYRLQISNIAFYEFLLSCGLSPRKSLIQKGIDVPHDYFSDFCRGVIDGDGNIRKWTHPGNQNEQWALRIYSASRDFIVWLQERIEQTLGANGRIYKEKSPEKNEMYILKYGKKAAVKILGACYYQKALALKRKAKLAEECCSSKMGWSRSKTIFKPGRVVESVYT